MARRKKRMKPLLYIQQPEYQEVSTSMQDKFIFNDREQIVKAEVKPLEDNISESPVAIETEDNIQEEMTPNTDEEKEKKPFREMTIEEKIEYLQQFPVSVVKIQYSFITTDDRIIAYFVSKDEDYISVIPKNKRKPVRIAIDEIQDIKIRGL